MSSEPSSDRYVDPNARLLASVIPPPPPTLRARLARFVTARRSSDLKRIARWSRSREGRSCFFAALAGVALTLGFYRSEASSAASAGPAGTTVRLPAASAPVAAGTNVRSEPLALTPTAPMPSAAAPSPEAIIETAAAVAGDAVEDRAPASALADAEHADDSAGLTPRRASASKGSGKKAAKHARKTKRQALANRSARGGRRAKAQRATAAGPLAAWLATQRSKDASSAKRR